MFFRQLYYALPDTALVSLDTWRRESRGSLLILLTDAIISLTSIFAMVRLSLNCTTRSPSIFLITNCKQLSSSHGSGFSNGHLRVSSFRHWSSKSLYSSFMSLEFHTLSSKVMSLMILSWSVVRISRKSLFHLSSTLSSSGGSSSFDE